MFGNTHVVADRIAAGLGHAFDVTAVAVADAVPEVIAGADLVVVGGPTHVHGMTSARSREAAREMAAEGKDDVELDPHAPGPGLKDWIASLDGAEHTFAASFDTRIDVSALLSGRASKGIARRLRGKGIDVVVEPESFLVDNHNHLLPGEAERAQAWGLELTTRVTAHSPERP